jgi:hypothetical protein
VHIQPNNATRTGSIISSKRKFRVATTSDVFGLKVDVCATGRKREIIGGQADEELRDTWNHKPRSALVHEYRQDCSWLTVPPITNDPSSKGIKGSIGPRGAVPLQSGRVDEEAVTVTARGRSSCASVDADRLPASVSGVGQCQFHAPELLVSWVIPSSMDIRYPTRGTQCPSRTLEGSSAPQRLKCWSHRGTPSLQ